MEPYGASGLHRELLEELKRYLVSQYFGKSPVLRKQLEKELGKEFVLHRRPFIESTPAYLQSENGLEEAELPGCLSEFFNSLTDAKLGVYKKPYAHQVEALRAATEGRDILVSTGTGSGKTECFLWPMIAKMATEAHENPKGWKMRAVRTIVLYPMNALVSDQQSRLRRILGDPDGKFEQIFSRLSTVSPRRPQFGMYTGRTPYPGPGSQKSADKNLARTLSSLLPKSESEAIWEEEEEKKILHFPEEYISDLRSRGRIPAKYDLKEFIRGLKDGRHCTNHRDAELLTRFEMQGTPPDILITNYSMLEYMMLRRRDAEIWNKTREWLEKNPSERLLFVIDEAHMYRGASGGEVALLIRRLFNRLGIDRSRVQFILTTASLPNDKKTEVETFAEELTGLDTKLRDARRFELIFGTRSSLPEGSGKIIPQAVLDSINLQAFDKDDEGRLSEINKFALSAGRKTPLSSLKEAGLWLGTVIWDYREFRALIAKTRGEAISLSDLARSLFPDIRDGTKALRAVSVLLALAPLARNPDGSVVYPARMHMLFRGLKGVFACLNPKCPEGTSDDGVYLGKILYDGGTLKCPCCGHSVYELESDRNCGALFVKGFVSETHEQSYLWPSKESDPERVLKEIQLYIPQEGEKPSENVSRCWLNTKSGYVYFNDNHAEEPGWRVMYYQPEKTGKGADKTAGLTFSKCPHCCQRLYGDTIRTFATRGNQAFFNLVLGQFKFQPAVSGKADRPKELPNQGRKVLVFSDSRQRAAKLARDLSEASDSNACRQIAGRVLSHYEKDDWPDMESFYAAFAEEAAKANVPLFYGEDAAAFRARGNEELRRAKRKAEKGKPYVPGKYETGPAQYQEQFLKLFCAPYNTLFDSGICWLEPSENALDDAMMAIEEYKLPLKDEDFIRFFAIWSMLACKEKPVLDPNISLTTRLRVRPYFAGKSIGLDPEKLVPEILGNCMGWSLKQREEINRILSETFTSGIQGQPTEKGINLGMVKPRFDFEHQWYRCEKCSEITPFPANGKCPYCGSGNLKKMTPEDMQAFDFWRSPIEKALDGNPIRNIDTEEHTAQISHKDQRLDLWSKTERYEQRFQDLVQEGETPIDILSCTTTMEVGIDIGSLVAVSLRNVPPTRENYQQRAGRAGRRGASLSSILTFCEDGAHDSYYFANPKSMLNGEPRTPWIDVNNPKLVERHLRLELLKAFAEQRNSDLDSMPAPDFLSDENETELKAFAEDWTPSKGLLAPESNPIDLRSFRSELIDSYQELRKSQLEHPELYANMSALDALYSEGLIPTYSFPKDVVSLYIQKPADPKKLDYQVERGLDIAISEYAPGRSIVVDKKTYRIGGLFCPPGQGGNWESPAETYVKDPRYVREISACEHCDWFGLETDLHNGKCPFCGSSDVKAQRSMLRPWGFAPKNGEEERATDSDEVYSAASVPMYSALPSSEEEMVRPWPDGRVRMAFRTGQRILMTNRGPAGRGFAVCTLCGAAAPVPASNKKKSILEGFGRPYRNGSTKHLPSCSHVEQIFNLGFDFITDMLVFEIQLDEKVLETENSPENLWLSRACQTLAEGLRLSASKLLDIEITELLAGYRVRRPASGTFADIYLYDSLSSGAGYAVALKPVVDELFSETLKLFTNCKCQTACHDCLINFRNQSLQNLLDRFSGIDLLNWAMHGKTAAYKTAEEQWTLVQQLDEILNAFGTKLKFEDGHIFSVFENKEKEIVVYPAMLAEPKKRKNTVFISEASLRFNKPSAVKKILSPDESE